MQLGVDDFTSQLDKNDSDSPNYFFSSNLGVELNIKPNRYVAFGGFASGEFGQILFETDIGTFKGFSAGLILKLSNLIPDFAFHVGIEHSIDFSLINPIRSYHMRCNSLKNFLELSM